MNELKDQLFGKVHGDMDVVKKILDKIPGFKGYVERQARRDSDKLLRDTIFRNFRELEGRVSDLQREFIGQGQLMYVDDLEAAAVRLRTFADRVRTAPRGYSSLFEAVKIGEDELLRLYEYDASLLEMGDTVSRAIDNVQASVGTEGLPAALRALESSARDCIAAYERREDVIAAG
jgi:hypothetical protein